MKRFQRASMHSRCVRRLALHVAHKHGVVKAAHILNIHRSSIWRWKRYGIDPAERRKQRTLFYQCEAPLRSFLQAHPFATLLDARAHLHQRAGVAVSTKSLGRMVRRLGFSRKRAKLRGLPKKDLAAAQLKFRTEYLNHLSAGGGGRLVSMDECAFSERLKPVYGYSPKGQPLLLASRGASTWVHWSLLLAVFSDGEHASFMKKGAIRQTDVYDFLHRLDLTVNDSIVLDNASIHHGAQLHTQAKVINTPPYSPECNPVELCFARIKHEFRRLNVRLPTVNATDDIAQGVPDLVAAAMPALSSGAIRACFGYVSYMLSFARFDCCILA